MLLHILLEDLVVLCGRPYEEMLQECAVQRLFIGASEKLAECIIASVKVTCFCCILSNKRF